MGKGSVSMDEPECVDSFHRTASESAPGRWAVASCRLGIQLDYPELFRPLRESTFKLGELVGLNQAIIKGQPDGRIRGL